MNKTAFYLYNPIYLTADPLTKIRLLHNLCQGGMIMKSTISLPSVTWVMKAQDALREAGIEATAVRLRPGQSPKGCSWGVEVDRLNEDKADSILISADIPHNLLR